MKRISMILLFLVLCFAISACGQEDDNRTDHVVESTADGVQDDSRTNEPEENVKDETVQEADGGIQNERSNVEASEGQVFDLEAGTVMLNSGYEMPILGIGTFRLSQSEAEDSVYWALRDGYRLIDTARIYGNESGVGKGIQRAIDEGFVTREEVFVTTKMWTDDYGNGAAAIDASLERLGLNYIDLMILHHSAPGSDVEAYQAMEKAVEDGKLRSIGLSNYYTPEDFDRLVNATSITPALLQNETHPYYQSMEMKEHLRMLLARGRCKNISKEEVHALVDEIYEEYGRV